MTGGCFDNKTSAVGVVSPKKRIINSRCSPSYLKEIERMGFGSLGHLPLWHVNHRMLVELANSYNTDTHTLETPTITLRVTDDLVGKALGLPYRGDMFREPNSSLIIYLNHVFCVHAEMPIFLKHLCLLLT